MSVRIQEAEFDPAEELRAFRAGDETGAIVSFTGVVRGAGELDYVEIEHYPAMTARAIEAMVSKARERFDLTGVMVLHRFGLMRPGEPIMMVATAASHRAEAFQAADYLMDYLKSRAPFWKKEVSGGDAHWVEAVEKDETALKRW